MRDKNFLAVPEIMRNEVDRWGAIAKKAGVNPE